MSDLASLHSQRSTVDSSPQSAVHCRRTFTRRADVESGARMLTDLRARLNELIGRWNVAVDEMSETETSFLAFGTRGNQPVVLKVIKREGDEWHSGEIANAFDGNGVVRVYEYIEGAVLLERATPGGSLVGMSIYGNDEEATAILARVVEAMSGCRPPRRCPTTRDLARSFEQYVATGDQQIPADLVDAAHRCYADLAASERETTLLHGDLHHYNVLSDRRRGWLAIDPKGLVGEIEYEVGAALRNPIENPDLFTSPSTIESRLQRFTSELSLDVDRALRWAFAQAVLSAIWEVEDGRALDTTKPMITLAMNIRAMLAPDSRQSTVDSPQ
jgi:streptomycin 6-kinase